MNKPPKGQRPYSSRAGEVVVGTPAPEPRDRPDIGSVVAASGQPAGGAEGPQGPPAEDDVLALPAGALVALRRSGGLLFSSRAVVVYPDGRCTISAVGGGRAARNGVTRTVPAAQLATLRRTLGAIDLARLQAVPSGHQRPDAYAYEIAARAGRAPSALTVFEGAIPSALVPLLALLNPLLTDEG